MGSHVVDILRQGLWASLTGGWFYDPQQAIFCNTSHFYLWLFFLSFPFILYLTLESTVIIWAIYCGVIGVVFSLVKLTNYKLHNLFDTCEVIEEPSSKTGSQDKIDANKNNEAESGTAHVENIELMSLRNRNSSIRDTERSSDQPPHTVKVIAEDHSGEDNSDKQCTPDHDTDQQDKSDKEKDDSDGSSKPNIPTYITTKADIEKTPEHFHRELSLHYKNPTGHDKQYSASVYEKSAVRRTKSDLEPNAFKVHNRERNERFSRYTRKSLPSAPKISSVGMITEQPLFETGNLRPKHDKKSQSESGNIKDGMTLLKSNSDDDYRTRSQTSNVNFICKFEPMADSPETSLSSQLGRDECDKEIQVNVSQTRNHTSPQCSPSSSCSYISTGEVIADNNLSKVTSSWPGAIESCSRPNSGQTDSSSFLATLLNSQQPKQQLENDSYQVNKYLQHSDDGSSTSSQSRQSSVLGLDQLFCSDTDSMVSEGEVLNLSRQASTVSSSSATIEENATLHFKSSKSEDAVKHDDQIPTSSSSSPNTYHNDIDVMRRKGAIPKNYSRKKRNADVFDKESTSRSEPVDSDDYERRLLKSILQSDSDVSIQEQIKQLKEIIDSRREQVEGKDAAENEHERDEQKSEVKVDSQDGHRPDENDNKCTTPTENCALLPVTFSGSGMRKRHRSRDRSVHHRARRSSPPLYAALSSMVSGSHHLASCHEDTTEGAVHCFQDRDGNWFTYTFGDSTGVALNMPDPQDFWFDSLKNRWGTSSTSGSDSTVILENAKDEKAEETEGLNFDLYSAVPGLFDRPTPTDNESYSTVNCSVKEEKNKQFYNFEIFPKISMKIRFDRLALLAMLDRNLSIIETVIAIAMAVATGVLGALILSHGFYQDIWIFEFCLIMASCQYCLLKSVQPDAASPMHGYNHLIVFNRPFYFCVCCSLMLLLDYASINVPTQTVHVYGLSLFTESSLIFARDLLKVFILCFPLLFTIGLLPQVNTFCIYILEQIDMHVFGGNATTGLGASLYCILRSLLAVIPLYGLCYGALLSVGIDKCSDKYASQHVVFSIFCAVLVPVSYHLSRCASNPTFLWMLIKDLIWKKKEKESNSDELVDPLPAKLKECVSERLQSDFLVCLFLMVFVFAIHVSTVFSSPILQPVLFDVLSYITASFGFLIHYVIPQMQKEMPWLCCSHPILQRKERNYFEVKEPAQVMWFERMCIWLRFIEKNIMYPTVFLSGLTSSSALIVCKFGLYSGPLIIVICGMKLLRFAFCDTPKQYIILLFTVFFFKYDYRHSSETFLIDYFFMSIVFCKFCDFHLKMKFILTYIAPWQITWGSAFHAFAQPFSVPHSAMLFLQTFISSVFSAPLNPVLGSAIFITSYARPVKFWERDYNTKRVDHSNTRLSSQLERNPGADDNNLNSIFYEHLTRCLQHNLCGDLMLGRWGNVAQGDCFIMASDYLNALVHIVEMANGLVTFQLRGLEFRGTYCQQREVEAITEGVEDSSGFCCFDIGHLPHFLSLNAAFNQRWLAWEVVSSRYVLEGYSISDLSAASMFQVFDLRKVLITCYVKAIIYYTVRSPRLEEWLSNDTIHNALHSTTEDLDPTFNVHVDEDYDQCISGITRGSFCNIYYGWIQYCASRREKEICSDKDSVLVSLCFGLSLLGRRALGTASHNSGSSSVDFFLYGLHALFKGDFRITSTRDEWVFADMEMLRRVVAPAVRMSFKLHQEHFTSPDEYDDHQLLYDAITSHEQNMVISHEADPAWRNAVLSNTPCLLALRHVFDEGSDEYKIITLNKRFLTFRVVKINRECVRGLWAGQQQELIFLRNRNPERGSIQNAKQALRNMINSSCDQPIGYPIYVSPLTTSFSSTHQQLRSISIVGGEFVLKNVGQFFRNLWTRWRTRCDASCVGESTSFHEDFTFNRSCSHITAATTLGTGSIRSTSVQVHQPDIPLQNMGNRGSLISSASSMGKPSSFVPLSVFISENAAAAKELKEVSTISNRELSQKERAASFKINHKVMIMDASQVYDLINYRRTDMQWPNESWQAAGGKSGWGGWMPRKGMKGTVVHRWVPNHYNPVFRSFTDKVILLVHVVDRYVPIAETGVINLCSEV